MIRIYINNDFEANITSLMSNVQWANVKFFPKPTGELYGWLLTTLVKMLMSEESSSNKSCIVLFYWDDFLFLIGRKFIRNCKSKSFK